MKIPDKVTSIGEFTFSNCTNLTSVEIPNNVTRIERNTFYFCKSLASVTIPVSVTYIGVQAFSSCTNLTTINYAGTEEQWDAITKDSSWDKGAGSYAITYNYKE